MQLRSSPTSPYVRKVLVTALEAGVHDQLSLLATNPYAADSDLREQNPLSKVPCLMTPDGALFDSPVICEYLDTLGGGKVFPAAGEARFTALRQQAQADGILDASLLRRYELDRPEEMRSAPWQARQKAAVDAALDSFETECVSWNLDVTIGRISVGCALGYLDLRFADDNWRGSRPALEAWYAHFAERDSMQRTVPVTTS